MSNAQQRRASAVAVILLSAVLAYQTSVRSEQEQAKSVWKTCRIPEVWKKPPRDMYKGGKGHAWFRCFVKVPKSWQGKDLELFSEPIDDARAAYFNGIKVGASGSFPPSYRSGLGGPSRFTVPAKHVRFGAVNILAVRVFDSDGRRNFNVAAPVLFGNDEAIRTEGDWQYLLSDDLKWSKLTGAPPEEFTYSKVEDAALVERTLKKLKDDAGALSAKDSLKLFRVPDDLKLDQVLAEPIARQPLSFNFDERGRMWLVQYLQYPNPAGLKMVSRDKYLRTVYDKVPPAPPHHFRGSDKITIHEDTDGDGVFDKHKTFVEGLSLVSAAVKGRGGVWVLNPPYLLFYADKNNDDVPDGDPVVHLEGFGIEDSHSIANSLRWGPDGWLYACQGSTVTGHVKRPGKDEKPVHSLGQLIWRYHPETHRYEIFAEGGGNAFGLELDAKGRIFSGTNGGNTRGYHYVQGGYFRKGFGKHGPLSNPYAFGYFDHMAHHDVPRFTHSFIIYEGGTLPKKYDGQLFGVGPLQSHVIQSEFKPRQSSFQTRDLGVPVATSDSWFRPVAIDVGPDGGIYIADFYEQRIDHASHYQGRVHKESGRVYRLKAKDARPLKPFDYSKLSTRELVGLLGHKNRWHRQIALRLIGDRKDKSVVDMLRKHCLDSTGQLALESLWALHLCGGLSQDTAQKTLAHKDPHVRLWTVRLLCDDKELTTPLFNKILEMSATEPNVEVRCQLACSARRLPADKALPIVQSLLNRDEDLNDVYMPQLLWWAIESKAASDREAVLELFDDKKLWDRPLVKEHLLERIMRRYALSGKRNDLLSCARLFNGAPGPDHVKRLMSGFEKAYAGRALTNLPKELLTSLGKVGGGSLALQVRLADEKAVARALKIIVDKRAKQKERLQFVHIFGEIKQAQCVPVLMGLVETSRDDKIRAAALTALQSYNDPKVVAGVLKLHNTLPTEVRGVAQTLLVSRQKWALAFLTEVDEGRIKPELVPNQLVRRLLFHDDKRIAALVEKHWGKVQNATTEEMRKRIMAYSKIIAAGSGNPYRGKELFASNCAKCHILFREGGSIGPDLTSFKRDDLEFMLLNIVNPSAEIREGFENVVVVTTDGRAINGFVVEQDNRVVELRGIDGQSISVARTDIDEMAAVPQSLMPEGILKTLKAQQIRDLFAYLRATQPLP